MPVQIQASTLQEFCQRAYDLQHTTLTTAGLPPHAVLCLTESYLRSRGSSSGIAMHRMGFIVGPE